MSRCLMRAEDLPFVLPVVMDLAEPWSVLIFVSDGRAVAPIEADAFLASLLIIVLLLQLSGSWAISGHLRVVMSLLTASLARKHDIGELSSQSWVRKRRLIACHGCVDVLTELVVLDRGTGCKLWQLRGLIDASFFSQIKLVKSHMLKIVTALEDEWLSFSQSSVCVSYS